MKNNLKHFVCTVIILLISFSGGIAQTSNKHFSTGRNQSFDANWTFKKGKEIDAKAADFNDGTWRKLDLPHDWSIEDFSETPTDSTIGPFYKNAVGKNATAFTVGGTAWYRKTFTMDKSATGKKVFIQFEGVYMNSDVWLNGHHLGNHPNGYTSFIYDLTEYLNPAGQKNTLAVEVKNEGQNSRYYSGSGIYRQVWLSVVNPTHIQNWGVQIVSNKVSEQSAEIHVATKITNTTPNLTALVEIYSTDNQLISSKKEDISNKNTAEQIIVLNNPKLWNLENPYLYKAKITLLQNGKKTDEYTQNFGVRSIKFDAVTGFTLNGKMLKLMGACIHHDNGALGAAAFDRAEERKIELLKKNGYNAVRLAHNPYSSQLLDACDRIGLLVINEAFDMWNISKNPDDYSKYFKDWWQKDLTSIIQKDFNHPSIIMFSIGNEISECVDSLGYEYSKKMADFARTLDTTRAITSAIPFHIPLIKGKKWNTTAPFCEPLDVGGYNYAENNFEKDHILYPKRVMATTEYFTPKALENWNYVERLPNVIGMFSWSGMDYLGEAGIGLTRVKDKSEKTKGFQEMFMAPEWPIFNAACGDLDLIGNKKPSSYYLDVVCRRSPLEMLVHRPLLKTQKEHLGLWGFPDEIKSWTWPGHENDTLQVQVFTRSEKVTLELNGKIIGEQNLEKGAIKANFSVPYTAGKLVARCYNGNKEIATETIATTGKPYAIRLKADRNTIKADKNDLSFIAVEIVDEAGNVVPNVDDTFVKFKIVGQGTLAGVGNGNPRDMSSFQKPEKRVFQGRGMLIVKSSEKAGKITIRANVEGLKSSLLTIITTK